MDYEFAGWGWLFLDVISVAVLALVIFATYRSYQNLFAAPTPAERSRTVDKERLARRTAKARPG